jgi:hypothetical protein
MAGVDTAFAVIDTVWLVIKYGWWLVVLLIIAYIKIRNKNYPIEAVIIEKRGNNHIKTNDRVGKYVDKYTGLIGYKFMKSKDTIPVVDFDWILHNNRQDIGLADKIYNKLVNCAGTAFFYKYGSKQYKPVKVGEDENSKIEWEEVKDPKGNPITVSIIKPIDPRDKMDGLDFEVVDWDNMNFMTQEQRASIERRKKSSEFWKQIVIPAMIIGGAVVVVVIMMKFGYDFSMNMKNTNMQPVSETPKEITNPNIPVIGDLMPK